MHNNTFRFLSYYYDKRARVATFCYQGIDNIIFAEHVTFAPHPEEGRSFNVTNDRSLDEILDRAMFLAFILIGTSYYKVHPTPYIHLETPLDEFQAKFFSAVFQEGLSQYAFENRLTRNHLAHFFPTAGFTPLPALPYRGQGHLALQSGGKDSLLVSTLLNEHNISYTPWYLSSDPLGSHPAVVDNLFPDLVHAKASIAIRELDLEHLKSSTGALNGHVPITLIVESLALIQAILNNQNTVITSIAQEGNEPHAIVGNLPINHQWAKTWQAEQYLSEYVKRYISPDLHIGSPIRQYSELKVAELFVQKCWERYGFSFSSCNDVNYKQGINNSSLAWCGQCAKCANTYLLFCPFLPPENLQSIFRDQDLFRIPSLIKTFKGLLGIEGVMKPFECVGSIAELRAAYHARFRVPFQLYPEIYQQLLASRQPLPPYYADLPFAVPASDFDYQKTYPAQPYFTELLTSTTSS